jgi:hypothetical protein
MNLYERYVLPRLIDLAMRNKASLAERAQVIPRAAGLVLESPLFAINDVSVTGATYTDPARLQKVVDQLDGSTLLGADLGKAEATLAADPWVKRVRVERRPLRGVRIEIVERVPVATYMGTDQRWRVLDADEAAALRDFSQRFGHIQATLTGRHHDATCIWHPLIHLLLDATRPVAPLGYPHHA